MPEHVLDVRCGCGQALSFCLCEIPFNVEIDWKPGQLEAIQADLALARGQIGEASDGAFGAG